MSDDYYDYGQGDQSGVFTSGVDYGTNPNAGGYTYTEGTLPTIGDITPSPVTNPSSSDLFSWITNPQGGESGYTGPGIGGPGSDTATGPSSTATASNFIDQLMRGNWKVAGQALKGVFDPSGDYGIAPLLGLALALRGSKYFNPPAIQKVGYQGGIPQLTAVRPQTPVAQQRPEGYRPGQGGVTYFQPTQYIPKAASGGIANLAQGRFLRGGGDGVSDSIPAKFEASGQPARLADGEFVIPARVVSELGNGSSEAGARKLYAMMDRVERAAKKAKRGQDTHADKHLPA